MSNINGVLGQHLNALTIGLDRIHFIQNGLIDQVGEVFHFLKNNEDATNEEREEHLKRVKLSLDCIKTTEGFITLLQLELKKWNSQQQSNKD